MIFKVEAPPRGRAQSVKVTGGIVTGSLHCRNLVVISLLPRDDGPEWARDGLDHNTVQSPPRGPEVCCDARECTIGKGPCSDRVCSDIDVAVRRARVRA